MSRWCGTVAWSSAVGQSYLGSSTSCFQIDAAEKSHPSTFLSLSYNLAMKKPTPNIATTNYTRRGYKLKTV